MTTITHEDLGQDLRRIVITGRLDTQGTNEISAQLRELADAPVRSVIVDLSAVAFAASIAIGQLIVNARAVKARGGHLVLLVSAYSAVMMSLKSSGIDQLIPVFQNAPEAHVGALRGF
ncbi:MAG: STAS domain-containing protein [Usitatibacter sp.]